MSAEESRKLEFGSGERRLLRYTVISLSSLALLGGVVLLFWVLAQVVNALHAIIFPLAIAGVLALVLFPIVELFQRWLHLSRLLSVVSLFLVLASLFVLVIVLVVPSAVNQGIQFLESVPDMAERGHESVSRQFPNAMPMLKDAFGDMEFNSAMPEAEDAAERVMSYLGFMVGLGFVPLYLFFALLSGDRLKGFARTTMSVLSEKRRNDVLYLGQLFIHYVTAFFRGQLIIALIMGVMMAIGFSLVGLKAGIFFGLALGMLNIVPFLGSIIGVITVIPVALLQPDGGGTLVIMVLGVIVLTQLVESMFLTPKIMADRSGLHPVVVVVSILFWGTVLGGVVGMILAVPLTAFLFTVGQHLKTRLESPECCDEMEREAGKESVRENGRHTPDGAM